MTTGGTSYPITVTKSLRAQQIAAENGLPCVYIVDSGGAFLPLQSEIFPDAKHGGRSFANQAIMSANGVPQVSHSIIGLPFCCAQHDFRDARCRWWQACALRVAPTPQPAHAAGNTPTKVAYNKGAKTS